MAPSGLDLSVLLAVLSRHAVEVSPATDVGVGVALADMPLGEYDFALAVVPAGRADRSTSLSAIYIEIGVAAGRDLPLLVIAEPPDPPSPALAGVTTILTHVSNEDALDLRLSVFLRQLLVSPRTQERDLSRTVQAALAPGPYAERLQAVRNAPAAFRGLAFEQLVSSLVQDAGAQAEHRSPGGPDTGIDFAAFFPGEEQRLGAVMFQVKSGKVTRDTLRRAEMRLSEQVMQSGAGLGVLVYDQAPPGASGIPPAPLVIRLSIDELLADLEDRPLSGVLYQARSRAVHGL
jgi:hypothetical protein